MHDTKPNFPAYRGPVVDNSSFGVCPTPTVDDVVMSYHGTGGQRSRRFVDELFRSVFNPTPSPHLPLLVDGTRHDGAVWDCEDRRLAMTTDAYVVSPLFFPGGNIGTLAVCGSLNDLAMMGAAPRALTASFILEEGLPLASLRSIVGHMAQMAHQAQVQLVAGDTKVVEKGRGDGVFITTTALGAVSPSEPWQPSRIQPGDVLIVSGDVARHGVAVLSARANLDFKTLDGSPLSSDVANLWPTVSTLLDLSPQIACLRDLTRGGLGNTLIELCEQSRWSMDIDETCMPVSGPVAAACELLGLDPLYVACEGRFIAVVRAEVAREVLERLRRRNPAACIIGQVVQAERPHVSAKGPLGNRRQLDGHGADQLPRIC